MDREGIITRNKLEILFRLLDDFTPKKWEDMDDTENIIEQASMKYKELTRYCVKN